MSKKLSPLIVSYHSSLNSGDRALLEMNIKQLQAAFNCSKVTVTANWPNESYFQETTLFDTVASPWKLIDIRPGVSAWIQILRYMQSLAMARMYQAGFRSGIPAEWQSIFKTYAECDVVAAVSSTNFYSTGRYGWPFPVKIFIVELADLFHKPFYIMPQSIGPLRWQWEKKMLRSMYEKARIVFLRDQVSMRLADEIKLTKERYRFAPDPAFAYPSASEEAALQCLNRYGFCKGRSAMGMTVIPWQGKWVSGMVMENYYASMARFLSEFHNKTGADVYIFNQVTGPTILDDDRAGTKILLKHMGGGRDWLKNVDEVLPAAMLKACYGQMDLFLATRMHSGIFALGMNVPVVFIGYITKTRGLMEWLGLEDWVVDLAAVNDEILLQKTLMAWDECAERKEKLAGIIPAIVRQVFETAEVIQQDYGSIG
jgi:colanic acid/amylovoran biosynthesis protein